MPSTQSSSSSSTGFQGIEDPAALAILKQFLTDWSAGGSADYKAQRADRLRSIGDTRKLLQDYSGQAAIYDAAALMEDQVTDTYRKSMPAIVRAIQGAGTSAGSMQGLLSSQLATDTAREAAALGAQQKTAYGNISANLSNILEGLTRTDNTIAQNLIQGLNAARISRQSSSSTSSGSSFEGGGGGGGSRGSGGDSGRGVRSGGDRGAGGGYSNRLGSSGGFGFPVATVDENGRVNVSGGTAGGLSFDDLDYNPYYTGQVGSGTGQIMGGLGEDPYYLNTGGLIRGEFFDPFALSRVGEEESQATAFNQTGQAASWEEALAGSTAYGQTTGTFSDPYAEWPDYYDDGAW
jgi:hypothetical protein